MTKLGQGVEVRAHYPSDFMQVQKVSSPKCQKCRLCPFMTPSDIFYLFKGQRRHFSTF